MRVTGRERLCGIELLRRESFNKIGFKLLHRRATIRTLQKKLALILANRGRRSSPRRLDRNRSRHTSNALQVSRRNIFVNLNWMKNTTDRDSTTSVWSLDVCVARSVMDSENDTEVLSKFRLKQLVSGRSLTSTDNSSSAQKQRPRGVESVPNTTAEVGTSFNSLVFAGSARTMNWLA